MLAPASSPAFVHQIACCRARSNELVRENKRNADAVRAADGIPAITSTLSASLITSRTKIEAVEALLNIARAGAAHSIAIGNTGILPELLELVRMSSSTHVKSLTLELVACLMREEKNCLVAVACGAVAPLMDIIDSHEVLDASRAAIALKSISRLADAFSSAETSRVVRSLLCMKSRAETASGELAADLLQISLTLTRLLELALSMPLEQESSSTAEMDKEQQLKSALGTATGRFAAVTSPNDAEEQSHDRSEHAAYNSKQAAKAPMRRAPFDSKLPLMDGMHEVEHGLLNVLLESGKSPTLDDLDDQLGCGLAKCVQALVERTVAAAMDHEDVAAAVSMKALASSLPIPMDLAQQLEDWLCARPEEVQAVRERAAAAAAKALTTGKTPGRKANSKTKGAR